MQNEIRMRMVVIKCFIAFVFLSTSMGQNYSFVGRNSLSIPIGTIFPSSQTEIENVFKFVLRTYNVRAPTRRDTWNQNAPVVRFQAFIQNAPSNDSYRLVQEFCNLVSQRTFAVFGRFDSNTLNMAESYSTVFRMPWISTGISSGSQSRYMTSLFTPLAGPLLAVTNKWKCNHMTYFYDQREIHLSLRELFDYSIQNNVQVQVRNMGGKKNILPDLRQLSKTEEHVFVFDVTRNTSLNVLQQLRDIGMLTPEYQFIFTDLSLANMDLLDFTSGGANITLFSIVDQTSQEYRTFESSFRDSNTKTDVITYEGALIYDAFKVLYLAMRSLLDQGYDLQYHVKQENAKGRNPQGRCHDLPADILQSGYDISRAIKKTKFGGLTGQVQFNDLGQRVNYSVNVLSLEMTGLRTVGLWKDTQVGGGGGFNLTIDRTLDHDKIWKKYINQTIIVTTILEEPYASLKKDWKMFKGNDRYEGYCVDLLKEISRIVPMTYILRGVLDGQYGSKDEKTGIWNGMVGEVKYNKAHMAVAPLTITSAREAVVDFTKPFMSLGISIMIKRPEKEKPHIFSFLEPLAEEIWICIVFAYIGVSVVLFFVSRFSPYEWHRASVLQTGDEEEVDQSADFGIKNSLWFSLGTFMQQGADISPKSFSGRLIGGVWWFFTLIIVSSYTANLAAFLTVERMGTTIKGVEDLAKQSEIKYGMLKSGSTASFFKETPIALYEKMWNFMKNQEPSVFVKNNKEGIERVRSSNAKYAFLMESTLNDYTAQRKPCNTMRVGANLDSKGYGIALPKGSPIYDSINLAILTLRERGNLQQLRKLWWYDKSQCTDTVQSKSDKTLALGLANVAGVFYVLLAGMTIALFSALVEYTYKVATLTRNKRGKLKKKCQNCIETLPCLRPSADL